VNRQVVLRLLDTFFRHFWLYLIPVVLVGGVGIWAATSTDDSYQSFGTMKVESNALVAELTGSESDPGFGWQSPAAATADSFNALMRTATFVDNVAVNAGLEEAIDTGLITAQEVHGSLAVYPDGARLVKVVASNRYPDVAHRLARAAMVTYTDAVIANEVSDSTVAINFLEQKLPDYETAVADAERAFERWLGANPAPDDGDERPEDERVQLERLQAAIATREQQLADAQLSIEQAELTVEQKSAEVEQRLQVIDPPQEPTAPQPKMRKMIMTVGMALILGCLLSLAGVVIGTILDRTIRFPGDVKARLDTRMLAVVPRTRLTAAMRKRFEAAEGITPAVVPAPAVVAAPVAENVEDIEAEVESPADADASPTMAEDEDDDRVPASQQPGSPQEARYVSNGTRASVTPMRVT
jgi:capsular polysaccharide biosynthesis protein